MEQAEQPKYATLLYEVREALNISWNEYVLLDMIRYLSYKTGYCYKSPAKIALDLGFKKRGTNYLIAALIKKGLLERLTGSTLRVTDKYMASQMTGGQVLPGSEQTLPTTHVSGQKVPGVGKNLSQVGKILQNNRGLELHRTTVKNKQHSTNVLGADAPPVYGKPEINDLFSYWQTVIGFKLESRIKQNRMACNNLLRKHGTDKLKRIIAGVALTYADPFAPRINDFISLQGRMNDLLAWGNKRQNATPNVVKIK